MFVRWHACFYPINIKTAKPTRLNNYVKEKVMIRINKSVNKIISIQIIGNPPLNPSDICFLFHTKHKVLY